MAAMSIALPPSLYNPELEFKYDLILSPSSPPRSSTFPSLSTPNSPDSLFSQPISTFQGPTSSATLAQTTLRKAILQQQLQMGFPPQQHLPTKRYQHPFLHEIHTASLHKKTQSTQLAGKLEDIMSNPLLIAPLQEQNQFHRQRLNSFTAPSSPTSLSQDYVYTAPCEHHPSKGQTDYLVNDMFPKLTHDLSTIEFGIRIADFMPLAFKTVPVAGLAEKELQLLHDLGDLPNVIQLQDSFVNDSGDTVLVLPMLKKFDVQAVNNSLCQVRKAIRQVLTGLAAVHAKNIVHLDINPSNLMVTHTKKDVVIIDFGLSMTVDRSCSSSSSPQVPACGTTGYIAPEILQPHFYEAHDPTIADLYSLGIVLGQMLEPYIPDCDLHYFGSKYLSVENTNQTVAHLKEFIAQGAQYPLVLVQAADLLRSMLEENPKDRCKSAQDLLDSHPFLMRSLSTPCEEAGAVAVEATLMLCDWLCRVQEIKYQKYLFQEKNGCEIYRYR
ncbi:Calcium-dependent protein kinase 4 [Gryganskiella cystojenkinii]|nr:Calcium-dependent protein kinase 4 [Gryganskiella cystojenkinii]